MTEDEKTRTIFIQTAGPREISAEFIYRWFSNKNYAISRTETLENYKKENQFDWARSLVVYEKKGGVKHGLA